MRIKSKLLHIDEDRLKNLNDIKEYLDLKVEEFNSPLFIDKDPISIPHLFQKKEDIEIAGFLTAMIAWGNRVSILKNAHRIIQIFDHAPLDFILNHQESDLKRLEGFVHRTFNETDLLVFVTGLKNLYQKGGLEEAFSKSHDLQQNLADFPELFFNFEPPRRSRKHLAQISKGSAAKRINMFLRWMVRQDDKGVDFGLWTQVDASQLYLPLDVHSGRVARKLGLLERKQDDWKAVLEVTDVLRHMDAKDPVKYDFALFGISAIESF